MKRLPLFLRSLLVLLLTARLSAVADVFAIPPAKPADINALSNAIVPMRETLIGISKTTFAALSGSVAGAASWRTRHISANNVKGFKLHYVGAYTVGGSFNNGYISAPLKASIQLADSSGNPTGRNFPVTFSAPASAPSLTGTTAIPAFVLDSDLIPIPLTEGQVFFVVTYATTTVIPVNTYLGNEAGESVYAGDGTTTTPPSWDSTQPGAIGVGPAAITAMLPVSEGRGVLLNGDSIAQNSNMDWSYINNNWLQRALGLTSSRPMPVVNAAVGGSRATGQVNTVEYYLCYYPLLMGWVRSVVYESGFNDFYSDLATATTVETAARANWATLRALGASNIVACKVIPGVSYTNGGFTEAYQVPRANDSERLLYNTWLDTQVGVTGGVDGVFDMAAALASSTNVSRLAAGPLTVLLSDTAGASTSTSAVRTSGSGAGTISTAGGVIALVHSGTTNYSQIRQFRSGSPNLLFTAFTLTNATAGDTYIVYQAWGGDVSSLAHPSGYGFRQIAAQWPSNLTTLLLR